MGESKLTKHFASEVELTDFAAQVGRLFPSDLPRAVIVGLSGTLGAGKTTFVRAMLRGRGYTGRVPSPTYTLLERYDLPGLTVVHLDLYRLGGDEELENLGLRDSLGDPATAILCEWPEHAPRFAMRCDLRLKLQETGATARRLDLEACTDLGNKALEQCCQSGIK